MVNNQQQIGTYANVLLDDWFKRTFGDESRKRLTTLMLQLFIPDREIESIRLAPQEHINPFDGKKDIRVDVECTDKDGARFMVEMQVAPQYDFFERFCYSLLNMSKMDSVPKGWDEDEIISLFFNSANISTFTPQERTKYINDMTTQRDFENQLIYAASKGMERGIEKGIEQGIEQGIEMGIEKGILRTAKAMIAEGLSDEIVAKCTGLSEEEIRAIK